jgi:hypothetical protein
MADISTARARAWKTRKEKYGPRGHSGAYTRWPPLGESLLRRALRLIAQLHVEGAVSEGQCCKALNVGRIEWRSLVDEERNAGRIPEYAEESNG